MGDGFRLTFATTMTPWTQDCMFFVVVTLSEQGIGVEPDPDYLKRCAREI